MKLKSTYNKIPIITLRGVVVYPGNKMHFDIGRKKSVLALQKSMAEDQMVFLVTQKKLSSETPTGKELYNVGVVAKVSQMVKNSDDSLKVFVEVGKKAVIKTLYEDGDFLEADIEIVPIKKFRNTVYCKALVKTAKDLFGEYCRIIRKIPEEIFLNGMDLNEPVSVAEYIASSIVIDVDSKQEILVADDPVVKLEILNDALNKELDLMVIEGEILEKLQANIDKNQREYYLREQIKVISEELGDEPLADEKLKYETKIKNLKLKNKSSEEFLLEEVKKMFKIPTSSPEASVIRTHIDTCLNLPWNKLTKNKINIEKAKQILDKEHYGLEKVKERIIEFLSVKKLNPDVKGPILCFCGPPGIGKTSIAKSIAKTMGKRYAKISLGGMKDESDIRGHRKTYVGSMPGRIINAIKLANTKNPLILLDEIDKMSSDFRGDPTAAMLEVLDSEQNMAFVDNYLEIPFDLSEVVFIATANDKYSIPAPLLDRMEIIDLTSYTSNEKFNIAKHHLISKQLKLHGITTKDIKIEDKAVSEIIDYYTCEAGVRDLERNIAKICRKVVQKKIEKMEHEEKSTKIVISNKNVSDYLGPRKFKLDGILKNDEVGIVTGLAWTSVGGEVMHIEVAVLDGTGRIELTGNLGDVMKESAKAAISYVRSRSSDFGIDKDFYKNKDIHIHVPEGAVPKDGPSAGVTICTALISELTKIPVKKDVAMTGEITLRGRLLTIGGLKEKTMAAYKTGVKTVFIPKGNEPDLYDIDSVVKNKVKFVLVDKMENVLAEALVCPIKNVESNYMLKN